MDIGLYHFKNAFRKRLEFALPYFKGVDPNLVSLALLPLGLATVWVYALAESCFWYYLLTVCLLFLRMVLATLDGFLAVHFQKQSVRGDFLNRAIPEICDIILYTALIFIHSTLMNVGLVFLGLAWLSSVLGLMGLITTKTIISVGPFGQTDRLAVLILFSLLAFLGGYCNWQIDFIYLFFCLGIVGGALTVLNRTMRQTLWRIPDAKV